MTMRRSADRWGGVDGQRHRIERIGQVCRRCESLNGATGYDILGQNVITTLWKAVDHGLRHVAAFEIADSVGTAVISDGWAEAML